MRGLLCILVILAGCASSPAPDTPAPDEPAPSAPAVWERAGCETWSGLVDAPASAFPGSSPERPVPGTAPGSIQAVLEGSHCGPDRDLVVAFPVASGGAWVGRWWSSNATHAALLAGWGMPAEHEVLLTYYSSRGGAVYNDGVGTQDGAHVLMVASVQQEGSGPGQSLTLRVADATVERHGTAGDAWWSGMAHMGSRALVEADDWRGPGHRQAGVALSMRPAAENPA